MGPLYAYFLTGVYLVFGHVLLLAHLAGILVGVGTVLLTAAIGRGGGRERDRWFYWLGAGACLGLYALGRANILIFAPVLAVWVFLALWKKIEPGAKGFWVRLGERLKNNWKPGLRRGGFLTARGRGLVGPAGRPSA